MFCSFIGHPLYNNKIKMEKKIEKCIECKGSLKPKLDLFKDVIENIKKEYEKAGVEYYEPEGYHCVECGACYDKNYKRQKINIHMLKNGKK